MITAWQLSGLDSVPARLVRFGKRRHAISVVVIEEDSVRVEARVGRKRVTCIEIGSRDVPGFDARLRKALARATAEAQTQMLETM